ncbi:MAG: N-6 DNA methylase [Candidatus Sumerlaeia bacterium]|nr:N-6 DNA methylase [Candidatus Sumerlaeia bacterium]
MSLEQRERIHEALNIFTTSSLLEASQGLFETLGYKSKRRPKRWNSAPSHFLNQYGQGEQPLNEKRALFDRWKAVEILFQLGDEEVRSALGYGEDLFGSAGEIDNKRIESYLFFAIQLEPKGEGLAYTRTELSNATRAVNALFPMPAMLLFKHGETISIAVINRRLHKRDASKDVMEKVTLIKDIATADPLRAHLEILSDLGIHALEDEFKFTNFAGLHAAWEKRLGTYALSERFYREVADWYFYALEKNQDIKFPRSIEEMADRTEEQQDEKKKQKSLFLIRLLTRLIFCWFLQEKRLIPRDMFRERIVKKLLKDASPASGTYYKAFLQNLFFATLNQEQDKRDWRKKYKGSRDGNVGITNLWRFADDLNDPAKLEAMLRDQVPFVNGGLFDCLDDRYTKEEALPDRFLDGFSERKDNTLHLPNALFFAKERTVDLSDVYHDKRRSREKLSGLIDILSRYKFTVEENTPLEEEIALDPELLGKVFENLLASYNDDTQTTARKALGAFYTPRSVVSYMVDEALCCFLATKVTSTSAAKVRQLIQTVPGEYDPHQHFSQDEINTLIQEIGKVRVLDHACGSGAYLMGALHRLVDLLQKLDPKNAAWKQDKLKAAQQLLDDRRKEGADEDEQRQLEERTQEIKRSFDEAFHELDYARKLYLIEDCIYGVDIQPVACQIAKLRFFISLIVDQKVKRKSANLGVRPMPNLETKIVAANALLPIDFPQLDLFSMGKVEDLRKDLLRIRHEHFDARTPQRKKRLREKDKSLRADIAKFLKESGLPSASANALAGWDPYDQSGFAPFFDPSWMFGFTQKDALFDVVLANPPYVRQEKIKDQKAALKPHYTQTYSGTADLYVYFYDRALQLLRPNGALSFITSNSFLSAAFAEGLRKTLVRETTIQSVIDFGETPVFTAITEPAILIASKASSKDNQVRALRWDEKLDPKDLKRTIDEEGFSLPQATLGSEIWKIEKPHILKLLKRLEEVGTHLGPLVTSRFYRGVLTGLNEAFVIDQVTYEQLVREDAKSSEVIYPFLRGRDVKRWSVTQPEQWLIFTRRGIDIRRYPAIHKHLSQYREKLEPKPSNWPSGKPWNGRKTGTYKWYEIQDNIAYWEEFAEPKIVYQDIARSYGMAWDESGAMLVNTCYFIPGQRPWLLGELLSPVIRFWVQKVLGHDEGGFLRLFSVHVGKFPIVPPEPKQADLMDSIARILIEGNRHKDLEARDTMMLGFYEQILNALVYELYFTEDLHRGDLHFFDLVEKATIPDVTALPEQNRIAAMRAAFERLYERSHPLQGALQSLESLDVVRMIEGRT